MLEGKNVVELNDEVLDKVSGGNAGESNEITITSLSQLAVGDIVSVENYIVTGEFCYVLKFESGRYKLVKYTKGLKWVDNAISFQTIPSGAILKKVGHDDQFVADNL